MASSWGLAFGQAWGNAWGALQDQPQAIASLGGVPHKVKRRQQPVIDDEAIQEPIPYGYVSRIRNEFLSSALADDLIQRARGRKSRAEEEALLLML